MPRTRSAVALAIIAIAGTVGRWPAATRAQQGAPYTDQQATAGQAAYVTSCGACHGRTLSGAGEAPPLAGQIDSERVPSGHLWGWLLDEHDAVGRGVPQRGPWFLPSFAVKRK